MASGKIAVYNLGELGVNVDKSPIHLDDGELTQSQNAIRDPLGVVGGIRKRPGLATFNTNAAAGSVKGGIGVPLLLTGTGATHTFKLGRLKPSSGITSVTDSIGWYSSTDEMTSASLIVDGTPGNPRSARRLGDWLGSGFNNGWLGIGGGSCVYRNRLYYAGDYYFHASFYPTLNAAPPIRVYDGSVDKDLCRIPYNPDIGAGTSVKAIVSMIVANGTIYLSTFDGGTKVGGTAQGRVFQLNPETGDLKQLGASFPVNQMPYALAWFAGRLWVGTDTQSTTAGNVYFIRPGIDSAWTLDVALATNYSVTGMTVYQGELYVSCAALISATTTGIVRKRTTLGVWSTPESYTQSGGVYCGYWGMCQFGTNLYLLRSNSGGGNSILIRKFDGTTWSTAATLLTSLNFTPWAYLSVQNGKLYVLWSQGNASTIYRSTDGTTFTNLSAAYATDFGVASAFGMLSS